MPTLANEHAPRTILLTALSGPPELVARPNPWWLRRIVGTMGTFLDGRIASGTPPERSRTLACRAAQLVALPHRRYLARCWLNLLDLARTPAVPGAKRAPICRRRIAAAEAEVRSMVLVLSGAGPIPAPGVAMASRLLNDGAGPLFNPLSPTELRSALREVTAHLDPATTL